MPLVKTQAEGINLADTFAFTGTVSGAGKILQIVHTQAQTVQSVTSTSYAGMNGYNTAITPSSTSSKILINFGYHVFRSTHTANAWRGSAVRLMRVTGDTVLLTDGADYGMAFVFDDVNERYMGYGQSSYLDTPNTTSATTYGLECKVTGGGGVEFNNSSYGRQGFITLYEIAG